MTPSASGARPQFDLNLLDKESNSALYKDQTVKWAEVCPITDMWIIL